MLLTFVTPDKFKIVAGGDGLEDYQFNKKMIHHLMCPDCGIESFARGKGPDGKEMIAINVRCLDGVDVEIAHADAVQRPRPVMRRRQSQQCPDADATPIAPLAEHHATLAPWNWPRSR